MNLEPFELFEYENYFSLTLDQDMFYDKISNMIQYGITHGNGHDYEYLARIFIIENCPQLVEKIVFDSEADMFCVYSKDKNTLEQFAYSKNS